MQHLILPNDISGLFWAVLHRFSLDQGGYSHSELRPNNQSIAPPARGHIRGLSNRVDLPRISHLSSKLTQG